MSIVYPNPNMPFSNSVIGPPLAWKCPNCGMGCSPSTPFCCRGNDVQSFTSSGTTSTKVKQTTNERNNDSNSPEFEGIRTR